MVRDAWLTELRTIHYDRILAYNEIGDSYNEGPDLLVDYRDGETRRELARNGLAGA
jgi:hypothetical protein